MKFFRISLWLITLLPAGAAELAFNRDIRPILSDKCFQCHGPDKNHRKGDLRLDVRDDAIAAKAIVPGKPDTSALIERITTTDADDLMPPAESHKSLTPAQRDTLRRWIAEGAKYEAHWAFVPPVKSSAGTSIDDFIRAELKNHGLGPSPRADAAT